MASIANLFRICEEMQKNLDRMDKQLDEAADLLLMSGTDGGETEARLFLAWLRKSGIHETTAPELSRLYAKYTVATNAPIVPENTIRHHLLSLNGVCKTQRDTHGERRWRPTVWEFGRADEQSHVNMTTCAV